LSSSDVPFQALNIWESQQKKFGWGLAAASKSLLFLNNFQFFAHTRFTRKELKYLQSFPLPQWDGSKLQLPSHYFFQKVIVVRAPNYARHPTHVLPNRLVMKERYKKEPWKIAMKAQLLKEWNSFDCFALVQPLAEPSLRSYAN